MDNANINQNESKVKVIADFSKSVGNNLVKTKFGVYVCTYVSLERMLRDIKILHELKPCGFRYDPGWGFGNNDQLNSPREFNSPQISGTKDELKIDFSDFDKLTETLQREDVDIMYVHAYNPLPLQDKTSEAARKLNDNLNMYSNWNTKPNDMETWGKVNYEYARHWKEKGWKVKYYEIWNEPDLQPVFFTGTKEDYFEIYKYGALGVKRADPDALVGGPAISFDTTWIEPFLDYVKENGLPLDFFSYHTYGDPEKKVTEIREILSRRPELENIEILLTEFNSFVPATEDFTTNGQIERFTAASRMLHDFKFFLDQRDIKSVYWAQYDDPEVFGDGVDRCGLISLDGRRKASFNAFKIYADMPPERKSVESFCPDIEGMASSDEHRACLAVWSMADDDKVIDIHFSGTDFNACNLKVYRIDSEHASFVDNPCSEELEAVEQHLFNNSGNITWSGLIPAKGVIYFVIEKCPD